MNEERTEILFRIFENAFRRFEKDVTQAIHDWEAGQREDFRQFCQRIVAITRQPLAELENRSK